MMDSLIIEWLKNSNNNCRKSTTTSLIECLLIISINGILISHDSLIEFCNKINNSQSFSSSPPLYGLNEQQFQTINNNIKSINNSNSNNNNNYDSNFNNIKFNSSISIITENNKYILDNNNNNDNNIITTYKIKNKRNISNLFFKVWRNLVLKNEILFHVRLYNLHFGSVSICWDEISNYKYQNYLNQIYIKKSKHGIRGNGVGGVDGGTQYTLTSDTLNFGITSIVFNTTNLTIADSNSIPNSVTCVDFDDCYATQIFTNSIFPNSITSLDFRGCISFNQSFDNWLPKQLRILKVGYFFQKSIELNQLPATLTELDLPVSYRGTIVPGSIPPLVKSLDFRYESEENKRLLTGRSVPISTTNLEFDYLFDQNIVFGDIPSNVISIKFGHRFNGTVAAGSLPISLRSLEFCYSFDKPIGVNVLPANLTYIDLYSFNQQLIPNLFPPCIKTIKFLSFNQPIPKRYFYNFKQLETLQFLYYTLDIPVETLPPSLTSLSLFGFQGPLQENVLPGSLLNLELDNYNVPFNDDVNLLPPSLTILRLGYPVGVPVKVGQLPSSITSLTLHSSNHILPHSLPCNLKELEITDSNFNQDLTVIGILPPSIQSIYLPRNIEYINTLNSNFASKYVKLKKR